MSTLELGKRTARAHETQAEPRYGTLLALAALSLTAAPVSAQTLGPPYAFLHQGSADINEDLRQQVDWATADGRVHVQSTSQSAGGNFATWAHVAHNVAILPNATRVTIHATPLLRDYAAEAFGGFVYSESHVSLQMVIWDNQDATPGDVFREIAHPTVELGTSRAAVWIPVSTFGHDVTRTITQTIDRAETAGTEQWHIAVALHSSATSVFGLAHAGAEMDVPAIVVRQFDRAGRELSGGPCSSCPYTVDFIGVDDDAAVWIDADGGALGGSPIFAAFGTSSSSLCPVLPICGRNRIVVKIGNRGGGDSGGTIILRRAGAEIWRHTSASAYWHHRGYTWRGVLDLDTSTSSPPVVIEDRFCGLPTDCME